MVPKGGHEAKVSAICSLLRRFTWNHVIVLVVHKDLSCEGFCTDLVSFFSYCFTMFDHVSPFNHRAIHGYTVSTRYSGIHYDLGRGHGTPTQSAVSMLLSLLSILPGVHVQVAKAARPIANLVVGHKMKGSWNDSGSYPLGI